MDTLNRYRDIIEQVLTNIIDPAEPNAPSREHPVFDRRSDHYLVIREGWEGDHRLHHCLVHLELRDGKVWIQKDGIEYGIATDLERAGIPKSDIVLGFHPADVRPYTEYAAA